MKNLTKKTPLKCIRRLTVIKKTYFFSNKKEWSKLLEDDVFDFLSLFEKANNTALSLVSPALVTLTTSLAGPSTTVKTMKVIIVTSLNTYCLAICDNGQ